MATAILVPCHCTNGKMSISVNGKPMEITCIDCNGLGTLTERQAAAIEASKQMWCRCEESGEGIYHPDSAGMKHHWTCSKCGKVTQIG